jgi:hypothetical protein
MYNPEAPFGLELMAARLMAEWLMAERKRQGQLLECITN